MNSILRFVTVQHTQDHENTGGMEGAVEEQQPDLAAALLGSSGDPEATESDDNEEELLALPASGPQDGGFWSSQSPTHRRLGVCCVP